MRLLRPTVASLVLALGAAACNASFSGTSGKKETAAQETDGDDGDDDGGTEEETVDPGTDLPTWVNGTYLTCDWREAAADSDAGAACGVVDKDGAARAFDADWKITWITFGKDGVTISHKEAGALDGQTSVVVELGGNLVADAVVVLVAKHGDARVRRKAVLAEKLPGLSTSELRACLAKDGASVKGCLQDAGITLANAAPGALPGLSTVAAVSGKDWPYFEVQAFEAGASIPYFTAELHQGAQGFFLRWNGVYTMDGFVALTAPQLTQLHEVMGQAPAVPAQTLHQGEACEAAMRATLKSDALPVGTSGPAPFAYLRLVVAGVDRDGYATAALAACHRLGPDAQKKIPEALALFAKGL